MPFGLIFGALFFGLIGGTLGLRWLLRPTLDGKLGGALVMALGASLVIGLLTRRPWARWVGAAVAATVCTYALSLVTNQGGVIDHAMLLASVVAAVLLVVPATGDPRPGAAGTGAGHAGRVGAAGWTAMISVLGLVVLGATADRGSAGPAPGSGGALPAAAIGKRVQWHSLSEGLERARGEHKPVLATFVTNWCPYCSKMARKTWRASSVVERLDDLVTVRVDVEDADASRGQDLAARYGVYGYPVQLLLDPDGRTLARHDGYQTPRQLLAWLDESLGAAASADPTSAFQISSP